MKAGFQELEHTADWALHVWAPTHEQLFETAARGMYHLMGIEGQGTAKETRRIDFLKGDPEEQLIAFLNELLFEIETEGFIFDEVVWTKDGTTLFALMKGCLGCKPAKEIKAATYHNLAVTGIDRGFETTIVFDV